MLRAELLRKLTPAHFVNGAQFDREVFTSTIAASRQIVDGIWKAFGAVVVINVFAFLFGGKVADGSLRFGYNVMVACCLAILFVCFVGWPIIKAYRTKKSGYKALGITQKDVEAAVRKVKSEP